MSSLKTKTTGKGLWVVLLAVIAFVLLVGAVVAEPLNAQVEVSWENPTQRTDGEPIVGDLTVTLHFSQSPGGSDIEMNAAPGATSIAFIARDEGFSTGDWYVYATASEAGNTAGPSAGSNTLDPFVLGPIPDSPPASPVLLKLTAAKP